MKKSWGKTKETTGKGVKTEEMFLSCLPGSERLATALSKCLKGLMDLSLLHIRSLGSVGLLHVHVLRNIHNKTSHPDEHALHILWFYWYKQIFWKPTIYLEIININFSIHTQFSLFEICMMSMYREENRQRCRQPTNNYRRQARTHFNICE